MTKEVWKPIRNYESLYEVSSLGRVKRVQSMDARGHLRKERILKQFVTPHGYSQVCLWKNSKKTTFLVHVLVANEFISNPLCLSDINHINEIKTDNRVENLERCSRSYNCRYGGATERRLLSRKLNKESGTTGLPIRGRIKVCVQNF